MEDKAQQERVLKAYQMGKKRYILVHGVLNWGISTAIIYRILLVLTTQGFSIEKLLKGLFSIETLYALIIFCPVGLLWGLFMFKWIERKVNEYEAHKKKKKRK
ncbi:hypothetical protein [Alkaliphilus crotonatoxidans]